MKDTIIPQKTLISCGRHPAVGQPIIDTAARRILLSLLKRIAEGRILLVEPHQTSVLGNPDPDEPMAATVTVHDPVFFREVVFGGSVGAGRAYIDGLFSCDDLTSLVRIIVRNRRILDDMDRGLARLSGPVRLAAHVLRRNTRSGSRKNIHAHYDLGNEFYALFLDRTLTYSCGIFENDESTLEEASIAKYERICRKLNLKADDDVLEIGCGWGGFALYCAKHYGCRVTAVTISREQFQLAQERICLAGLEGRIRLMLSDYRDVSGRFDKLVSIEMIEAVGHQFLDTFCRCCGRLLKDDGRMLLQAIVIDDRYYECHRHSVDFIKRYIFPGSCLPSVSRILEAVKTGTQLQLFHLEDITAHYVKTLRHWRQRFWGRVDAVRAMGFPEPFIRMWDFYLSYCEGAFAERYIGDVQMLMINPSSGRSPVPRGRF